MKLYNLCLKGDRKAFEVLYRRYYPILYNYGKIYSKDTDLVKNCLQNFFVKLMCNYSSLSETASVRCYLLKAFRYALYNELKAEERHHEIVSCQPEDLLTFQADQFIGDEDLTLETQEIKQALNKISSRQKEILYLYYIRELSHEEIAELLHINHQSSKNLLARSIAKLRDILLPDK